MKKKKDKLFFAKEMPVEQEQDISKLKRISHNEFTKLLKESKKPKRKRAA